MKVVIRHNSNLNRFVDGTSAVLKDITQQNIHCSVTLGGGKQGFKAIVHVREGQKTWERSTDLDQLISPDVIGAVHSVKKKKRIEEFQCARRAGKSLSELVALVQDILRNLFEATPVAVENGKVKFRLSITGTDYAGDFAITA